QKLPLAVRENFVPPGEAAAQNEDAAVGMALSNNIAVAIQSLSWPAEAPEILYLCRRKHKEAAELLDQRKSFDGMLGCSGHCRCSHHGRLLVLAASANGRKRGILDPLQLHLPWRSIDTPSIAGLALALHHVARCHFRFENLD